MKKSVFFNYVVIISIFFCGIILGMIFINHTSSNEISQITGYVDSLIENIKTNNNIDRWSCLFESLKQNFKIILLIWVLRFKYNW